MCFSLEEVYVITPLAARHPDSGTRAPALITRIRVPSRVAREAPGCRTASEVAVVAAGAAIVMFPVQRGGEGGIGTHVPECPDHPISAGERIARTPFGGCGFESRPLRRTNTLAAASAATSFSINAEAIDIPR